jgi:hypothetical protein
MVVMVLAREKSGSGHTAQQVLLEPGVRASSAGQPKRTPSVRTCQARTEKWGNRNPAARSKQTTWSELVHAHLFWSQIWALNASARTACASSPRVPLVRP